MAGRMFPKYFPPASPVRLPNYIKPHLGTFFSFSAIQIAQVLLPLAILPWLARILGPEVFGLLMYMCLLPPLVALIMDWGLTAGGARNCALHREAPDEIKTGLLEQVLSAKTLLGLICFFICMSALPLVPHAREHPLAWFLACCAGLARGSSPLWFFQGLGQGMKKMAVFDVAAAFFVFALSLVFIRKPGDWPLYLLFLALCKGCANYWLTREILLTLPVKLKLAQACRGIWHTRTLFVAPMSATICNYGTQFIMGYWLSAVESGILNACHKMFRALVGAANPLIQTLYPETCRLAAFGKNNVIKILALALGAVFLGMSLVSAIIYIAAPVIVKMALGDNYAGAAMALRPMLFAVPLMACNQTLASQGLLPLGLEKIQAFAMGCAALASFPLAIFLACVYGLAGCVWLPLVLEIIVFPILCTVFFLQGKKAAAAKNACPTQE